MLTAIRERRYDCSVCFLLIGVLDMVFRRTPKRRACLEVLNRCLAEPAAQVAFSSPFVI
jgi:hypothetical protein